MADYYPLLSKAVSALEPNTADARQAIYERARSALTRQLASMDPPVAQAILDRELGALEAVFVRIEADQNNLSADITATDLPITAPPIAAQPRPQVLPQKTKKNRKPLIAVLMSLAIVAVMAIGTLAFLRRNEPPAVANRPNQPAPVVVAERPATPAKTNDRVLPSTGDAPAPAPVQSAPPAATTPAATTPASPPVVATPPRVVSPPPAVAPPAVAPPAVAPPAVAPLAVAPTAPPSVPARTTVPLSTAAPPAAPVVSTPPAIAVANKAVMVLEGKEQGSAVEQRQGTVVWRTEMVSGGQGQPLQQAIKALVDVPEARTRTEITIQRNRDAAFPASHTIQVQFSAIGASDLGAVQSLSLLELRQNENQGGYPIAGQGIAVMENVFLIALTQLEPAQARNVEMMQSRPLLYLEFQFVGGRRGAMIIDKGISGQQAFDEAFRNWQ